MFYILATGNYFWRNYDGRIPADAVLGGQTNESRITYIGHGFVGKYGIVPGMIYSGVETMDVPIYGVERLKSNIEVSTDPILLLNILSVK